MPFTVYFTKKAKKRFLLLPQHDQKKVRRCIDRLEQEPFSRKFDIKKLTSQDTWRMRVGNIRVLYEVDQDKKRVIILAADYRGNVY
jgi:mRNA interferase RelE/StbE